jgi:hypothetical protein
MLFIELLGTLLLGFVLGRIYEIRQQLVSAQGLRNRKHPVERRLAHRRIQRSQADEREQLRPNKEVSAGPASALPFRSSPAVLAGGRLRDPQQPWAHVGGSSPQHHDNDAVAQQPMDQG